MSHNPYFHCKDSYALFRDEFMERARKVTGQHMGQSAIDNVLRRAMGYQEKATFESALKAQKKQDANTRLFKTLTDFENFCQNVSNHSNPRWKMTKAKVADFVSGYMGYLTTSDCRVELFRMECSSSTEHKAMKPESVQDASLFRSVDQFREESQKLCQQLNSIKLSALRLAMAKAQGFTDTRAYEAHLANLGSVAAAPANVVTDGHAYNPNIFVIKRHGYLFLQGPALSTEQKESRHMACWDDMMRHWLRQLDTERCEIQPVDIDGTTYIEARVHLVGVPVVQMNNLSAILANFYYCYRDRWEAGALCHRFSEAVFDYFIDAGSDNFRRLELNVEAVWDGEELENVVWGDDELPVDVFGVKDSVKQARRVFGDNRVEDVKRAVRWRLPKDIAERAEEYHASETLMNSTLTFMESSVIETMKRKYKGEECPHPLEFQLRVAEHKAAIFQVMLLSFLLGHTVTVHH